MAAHRRLNILWSDDDYVAIDKPSGLAAIPGRGEETSAIEELARQIGLPHSGQEDPRVRVVHRLDKDTSGVLVFAKNRDAQRHLAMQFQESRVRKEYLALVAGKPAEDRGEIDAPLAPHPASAKRMAVSKHGRPARTIWEEAERFKGYALLRVWPQTGKTHQIRVHLQSIALALAIDPLYRPIPPATPRGIFLSEFKRGYRAGEEGERPLIERLTLHARTLRFENRRGEPVEITAEPPKDFRAVLNMLRKYA